MNGGGPSRQLGQLPGRQKPLVSGPKEGGKWLEQRIIKYHLLADYTLTNSCPIGGKHTPTERIRKAHRTRGVIGLKGGGAMTGMTLRL